MLSWLGELQGMHSTRRPTSSSKNVMLSALALSLQRITVYGACVPAGWLVTQAARLRAYFNFILLTSATAVEAWALPPGLLEPVPADVLLRVSVCIGCLSTLAHDKRAW